MSSIIIQEGGLVTKDPADIKVYQFDWDTDNLAVGVTIATSSWTILAVSPSTSDTALTKDNESILAGNRKTQLRLTAGTLGQKYAIANKIRTSETPFQEKERSFEVLVENK